MRPNLSNGFVYQGRGNFTGPTYCGVSGAFYDVTCDQNNGGWHVYIEGANLASGACPEPSSMLLFGSAVVGLGGLLRRRLLG